MYRLPYVSHYFASSGLIKSCRDCLGMLVFMAIRQNQGLHTSPDCSERRSAFTTSFSVDINAIFRSDSANICIGSGNLVHR